MKRIILVRHAKSDWSEEQKSDHERGLNQRGKRDIPLMASILIQKYPIPELILSSDSNRTQATIDGITRLGYKYGRIEYTNALYLAPVKTFEQEISEVSDTVSTLLICAHNPGISDFLNHMCPANEFEEFPTLGTALIVLGIDSWKDIFTSNKNKLVRFDYPRKK